MALYVLGDTHLSLGASKPMDVFPGWNGYVERLERNWRKLIKPEDTIVLAPEIYPYSPAGKGNHRIKRIYPANDHPLQYGTELLGDHDPNPINARKHPGLCRPQPFRPGHAQSDEKCHTSLTEPGKSDTAGCCGTTTNRQYPASSHRQWPGNSFRYDQRNLCSLLHD